MAVWILSARLQAHCTQLLSKHLNRDIQGEKFIQNEEDEPGNIFTGAATGIYGGVKEIVGGVTGIFTNPYRRAKEEGVTGFFKGAGQGLLGALFAPVAAVMKLGTNLFVGMKNTATMFSKGKLKTRRFRHPRFISTSLPLQPYDEELAEVNAIVNKLGNIEFSTIIFFCDFKSLDERYDKADSTIIITDKLMLVVYDGKEEIENIELEKIVQVEVHNSNVNEFILLLYLNENKKSEEPSKKLYLWTSSVNTCVQTYQVLMKIISK